MQCALVNWFVTYAVIEFIKTAEKRRARYCKRAAHLTMAKCAVKLLSSNRISSNTKATGDITGILDIFGKKAVQETQRAPYVLKTEWVPYSLYANSESSSSLHVKVKNVSGAPLLTSVVVDLPKNLKFDRVGMVAHNEAKLGSVAPNEEKEVRFDVSSSVSADPGTYAVEVTVYAHYGDYTHLMNSAKKLAPVNVIQAR